MVKGKVGSYVKTVWRKVYFQEKSCILMEMVSRSITGSYHFFLTSKNN